MKRKRDARKIGPKSKHINIACTVHRYIGTYIHIREIGIFEEHK